MNVRSLAGLPDEAVRTASMEKYRHRAAGYDATCGPTWPIRERTIDLLDLQPGQAVLDVGCGTGLSLARLRECVGEAGHVYGFDQSPDMLEQARRRVAAAGWQNVHLHETPAQGLALPAPVDALLFHYTHDVLRSASAVDRLLACARPGAAVAIAGIKYFPFWLAPLNIWVYFKNHGYNGAPGELRSPWDRIAPRLEGWRLTSTQYGMGYIASGRVRA
ncbi:MAG: methyltransferase domain-containing protein [Methyloversatilis sp.]|jgi:arsenite methyltransferase|nr:methyltransferase domain-containing protein [Methyloversatilis sp.]